MPTILIAGGTGLLGQRLSQLLTTERGCRVLHLSRRENLNATFPAYRWDVDKMSIDQRAVDAADAIVNLAGAGIADERWTDTRKKNIISSRVNSVRLLKSAIEKRERPLPAYVAASAIGYYGNRGEELLTERSPQGRSGFLAESVGQWEAASWQMEPSVERLAILRIGVVLSTQGGALEKMLLPLKFLNATYFGNGQQWMSWIHIDDMCRLMIEAVENERFSGVFNGVAPNPARNKDLVLALKTASGRPALVLPVPEFALRLAMGEMADVVFESTRVSAEKTAATGFAYQFPTLPAALEDLLARHR